MAETVSDVLRDEVDAFQHFIFDTIDAIVGALDGCTAEELNWRPAAPATNSLYAIATHVLGNAEEKVLGTLRGVGPSQGVTCSSWWPDMPPSTGARRNLRGA